MTDPQPEALAEITVASSTGNYPVFVGSGGLDRVAGLLDELAPAHSYAVVSDHNVAPLHGAAVLRACAAAGLDATLYTFPAGESSKTRKSWSILTDELLDAGSGRDTVVVAVGGGVTGDLAGFVAATYMRGVPVVQVPTSYLAMIDASVGGKTGVDVRAGKNLVGSFHAPRFVVADPAVLVTLPEEERAQGLVEALKHGAIFDEGYFRRLVVHADRLLDAEPRAATSTVRRSIEIKAHFVGRDEHEAGLRQVLNFGHTVGHALEAASGMELGHGTAVAVGMILEAEIGERLGVTEPGTRGLIEEGVDSLGFGVGSAGTVDIDSVMGYLGADKKARSGRPRYVLLRRIGEVDDTEGWSREAPEALVREVLQESTTGL